jgi:hypothetical protein
MPTLAAKRKFSTIVVNSVSPPIRLPLENCKTSAIQLSGRAKLREPTMSSTAKPPPKSALSRLQNLANHMASPATVTSFPAEVVPQAPEDPLFGLMRAFRADNSKDKVDLVSVA